MKKILLVIVFFVALSTEAQVVNKFRDSSVFFKGVRFDSTLVFKGLKSGSTADTNVVVISSTGKASKISKSAFLGDLPIYSISDSSTVINYDVLNSQNTPPVSPSTGDVYLVGTVPTGAWVGHAKDIAEWNGSAWVFTDGVQGDFLYNATTALTYIFRSGNWVQTTGIPALNNGNNISSGLKIGTNNARSLTFETNNVNRGRFDSVGRFYVYDTSLRKPNKYLQIDSITGRLVASEISGGAFIPLSGTVSGSPVTGDIVTANEVSVKVANGYNTGYNILYFGESFISINNTNDGDGYIGETKFTNNGIEIANNNPIATGITGIMDFTSNITDLDYTQKKYVDNAISSNRKVDTSYIFRNATLDSTCMITVINGITYRSCAKDSVGSGTAYTFSTGLTNTSSTITNNLSTGVSGGQSVIGGTASGENLTLSSTSNATKGDLRFGTSAYKEVNNRLGIGTTSPQTSLHIYSTGSGNSTGQEILRLASSASGNGNGPRIQFTDGDNTTFISAIRSGVFGAANTGLIFSTGYNSSTDAVIINGVGNYGVGIGLGSLVLPTARLHLGAGTATANTAPIKLTAGTKLATPETGTLEFVTGRFVIQSDAITMGTSAGAPSSLIDMQSTTQGFLPPRMTATQASAISTPAQGLLLFVSDTNGTFTSVGWWGYNGSTWEKLNN